jgi:hypothetical protein
MIRLRLKIPLKILPDVVKMGVCLQSSEILLSTSLQGLPIRIMMGRLFFRFAYGI